MTSNVIVRFRDGTSRQFTNTEEQERRDLKRISYVQGFVVIFDGTDREFSYPTEIVQEIEFYYPKAQELSCASQ